MEKYKKKEIYVGTYSNIYSSDNDRIAIKVLNGKNRIYDQIPITCWS